MNGPLREHENFFTPFTPFQKIIFFHNLLQMRHLKIKINLATGEYKRGEI